jgi:beta-lactamase class A
MTSSPRTITRRALLGAVALVPVAACTTGTAPATPPPPGAAGPPDSAQATPPSPSAAAATNDHDDHLGALERKFDARIGVYATATSTATSIAYRADERFAFCSTFKGLAAAAVLHRNPLSHLDTVMTYTNDDLMKSSAITKRNVATGMTIRQLCDAAVRYSDGTAGNLLLRDLGGPAQLTAYARSLGDTATRMDRIEPYIVEATPGDPRDTTTPRAFGANYQKIVLGDALPADKRAFLRDLMECNATGARRIRAGLPQGWTVADKTGTGDYGTLNDFAIVWPSNSAPLVIAIMSSKAEKDAAYNEAVIAETAAYVAAALT